MFPSCEANMKLLSLLLAVLLQAPSPALTGKAYRFEKITDGVYYATAAGSMITGSNNVAIIGSRDVLVVDTGTTPAAARAFIEDLRSEERRVGKERRVHGAGCHAR